MYNNSVRVLLNGQIFAGFQRLYIRMSLDEICHSLEMDVADGARLAIKKHDQIQVRYDSSGVDRLVTTVYVDSISRLLNTRAVSFRVSGRSRARDIVDSSTSGQLHNQKLGQILTVIGRDFGVPVKLFTSGDQILSFEWENESPWNKLTTAALAQESLLYSSQIGGLYLAKVAGSPRLEGFSLAQNKNVEEISVEENGAQQFRKYIIKGAAGEATATDNSAPSHRILTINMTDDTLSLQDLQRYANVQKQRRRSDKIRVRLSGWGLNTEQVRVLQQRVAGSNSRAVRERLFGFETLWGLNFYVPVEAPNYGINAKLLTSQIEYSVERDAVSCTVQLVPRSTYIAS